MIASSRLPLEGLRVVEVLGASTPLHVQCAIALAGKIAAELGADVRVMPGVANAALSKSALHPDCQALFTFLYAEKSWLESYSTSEVDAADAMLTDRSVVLPPNKTAIVVSEFGNHSRLQNMPASELTILAMSGLLHVMGLQAGSPLRLPGHQPAYAAGLAAYLAMTAALLSEVPRVADVCMLDAMVWVNWKLPAVALLSPNASPVLGGEWQAVPTMDGHVALVYQERDWPALVDLIGIPELRDARFATRSARVAHYDALLELIRPWFAVRTKETIYALAKAKGLPLGPVWTARDIQRDAQYLERDFLRLLPAGGVVPRIPLMWNGARPGVLSPHADQRMREVLDGCI